MRLKGLKKSTQYLIISVIGIPIILIGIFMLINAIREDDNKQILIKSALLFFWLLLTVSNFFLYKNQKRKEETM